MDAAPQLSPGREKVVRLSKEVATRSGDFHR